jgi:hypothetical protein
MGERRKARSARPFASAATGEQGSRRSVSIATLQATRGTDCPRQGMQYESATGSSPKDETPIPVRDLSGGSVKQRE